MGFFRVLLKSLFTLFFLCLGIVIIGIPASDATPAAQEPYALHSTAFVENKGQWDARARFQAQTSVGTWFLTDREWWWTITAPTTPDTPDARWNEPLEQEPERYRRVNLRMQFIGSNPDAVATPFERTETLTHYLHGNDPAQWVTDVPTWAGVRYQNFYPGIDLEVTTARGVATPRLIVRDARRNGLAQVQVQIEGADTVAVNERGITLHTAPGVYTLPLLEVVDSDGLPMAAPPPILQDEVLIHPFTSVPSLPRAPTTPAGDGVGLPSNLIYSTYLGGTDSDTGTGVGVDAHGAMYITGRTSSMDFPTTPGAYDTTPVSNGYGFIDIFISKLSPDGQSLIFSTYISGNNSNYARALKVGPDGSVYVAGDTRSRNFPTTPHSPGGFRGSIVAFVLRLHPSGSSLIYSILLGGNISVDDSDPGAAASDLALGDDGSVTIVGSTSAVDFPVTSGAYDTYFESSDFANAFVTRISPTGDELLFSTFLGGRGDEDHTAVDVDDQGNTYVFGSTSSSDFPTTPGAFDRQYDLFSFFVTKFNPDGSDLVYSTYFGSAPGRGLSRIRIGADYSAYVVSAMAGGTIPTTPGAYDTECGYQGQGCNFSNEDMFAFRLNPDGSDLIYSTYLGGSGADSGGDLILNADGTIYILGYMGSPEFPYTPGAYQDFHPQLLLLNASGSELLYSGSPPGDGSGFKFALQAPGVLVVGGSGGALHQYTVTPDAYQPTITGYIDAALARVVVPPMATEQVITSAGGEVHSTVDQRHYVIAPNTFTDTVLFTHAPRHALSLPAFPAHLMVGYPFANTAVLSGTATLVQPQQRYQLNLTYSDAQLGGMHESSLRLYRWTGSVWLPEPTAVYQPESNRITAAPDSTGWWALFAQPRRLFLPAVRR